MRTPDKGSKRQLIFEGLVDVILSQPNCQFEGEVEAMMSQHPYLATQDKKYVTAVMSDSRETPDTFGGMIAAQGSGHHDKVWVVLTTDGQPLTEAHRDLVLAGHHRQMRTVAGYLKRGDRTLDMMLGLTTDPQARREIEITKLAVSNAQVAVELILS